MKIRSVSLVSPAKKFDLLVLLCLISQLHKQYNYVICYSCTNIPYKLYIASQQKSNIIIILRSVSYYTIKKSMRNQQLLPDQPYSLPQIFVLLTCCFHRTVGRVKVVNKQKIWVGTHCSLYPPPPHTIHPPLADPVLGESVNCIPEAPDTRNSVN